MAEGVQFQLERQLEELEQMVHCGLFTKEETNAIVKKRKRCEYKVHRHSKSKEDYLQYINYESALLALLRKRREKEGYGFRKKEIDHAILNRIHSLFRAAIHRFQGDVSLWLTYIEFCKEKRNRAMVSRTFSDLLAIHNRDPSLWIMAAQWEMEENQDAETARSLLQRGLRFLGESIILWKEYLRMELIHVETMRKRMLALTSATSGEEAPDDVAEDPIIAGKIVDVVYRQAVTAIPDDVDLPFECLQVAKAFAETMPQLEADIYEDLRTRYAAEPRAWDALARRHLDGRISKQTPTTSVIGGDEDADVERRRVAEIERRESDAVETFEEGLKATRGDAALYKLAILFAVEILEKGDAKEPTLRMGRLSVAVDWLKKAETAEKMEEELYLDWIRILRNFNDDDDDDCENFVSVLDRALTRIPSSYRLWSIKLQKSINEACFAGNDAVRDVLEKAVDKVNEKDSWTLWETYLDWMEATHDDDDDAAIDAAFRRACITTGREASMLAKLAFVRHAADKAGDDDDKNKTLLRVYDSLRIHRPHSADYYRFVMDRLNDAERKRRVYSDALDECGASDVEMWLEYEDFESQEGDSSVAGSIYQRALRSLDAKLVPVYEAKHTLKRTGHLFTS